MMERAFGQGQLQGPLLEAAAPSRSLQLKLACSSRGSPAHCQARAAVSARLHALQVTAKLERQRIPEAMDSLLIALRKYDRERLNELFAEPVCTKQYPDYPDVVREPMDLKTLG